MSYTKEFFRLIQNNPDITFKNASGKSQLYLYKNLLPFSITKELWNLTIKIEIHDLFSDRDLKKDRAIADIDSTLKMPNETSKEPQFSGYAGAEILSDLFNDDFESINTLFSPSRFKTPEDAYDYMIDSFEDVWYLANLYAEVHKINPDYESVRNFSFNSKKD